MKGHIRERSPGRWAIILDMRDPETGKRKRKWHSFKGSKKEARIECSRLITAMTQGSYIEPAKTTLLQFLERWLEHIKTQVAPRTHERYDELARKNIAPLIGNTVLSKLRPETISGAYAKALASGRRDGTGGLSPRTVHHMHRCLRQALQQAVDWNILVRNPADSVKPPKVERAEMKVLDDDGIADLLEAARGGAMFMPILLAATTGMRRGEIAALRWRSVDLTHGQLSVVVSAEQTAAGVRYKEPKTGRARTLALSASLVEELRRHRAKQAEELLKLGVRLSDETFVVAQADGSPYQPRSLTHAFEKLLAKHRLPSIPLHGLRHSHATAMLVAGVAPKVVQERLGHSSITVTMDIYSHTMPGMQQDAAERVDAGLQAALNRRRK